MATFLYNPDRKPKNTLLAEFVVRTEIYDDIMHDLETSDMEHPEQHYLLVGQRGAGKTTLLNRIKYGIEDSALLKGKVIPVLFSEEQYNISELANLWENIAQYLEDYQGFEGLYEEMEANCDKPHYEEKSYDVLEKHLKTRNKKLVLLIDNIGDLLKKMEKTEVHRLREILQTKNDLRLIVGSPFYLETVLDYQQPFFEFFKVVRLEGLTNEETKQLLLKLAQINNEEEKIKEIIENTPERIETLRTLTGGVPRTMALMFNIFVEYNNESTVQDLEKILDAVTPLYKHRMDDLPTQQQKIVDAVAKHWDGISVKELKEKLRLESKIISAQLRQLQKNGIIEIVETGTKNNIYFLKERFFNIWYLMRYGRKYDKQRVIWLVKFLESWCSENELEQRIIDFVQKIKDNQLDEQIIEFYGEAYAALSSLRSEIRIKLKENTPLYLSSKIIIEDLELYKLAFEKVEKNEHRKALDLMRQIKSLNEQAGILLLSILLKHLMDDRDYFFDLSSDLKDRLQKNTVLEFSSFELFLLLVLSYYNSIKDLDESRFVDAHKHLIFVLKNAMALGDAQEEPVIILVKGLTIDFLAFEQYHVVNQVLEEFPEWKDKMKPIYYANLAFLGYKNELLKMGSELRDKVAEVIEEIKKIRDEIKK